MEEAESAAAAAEEERVIFLQTPHPLPSRHSTQFSTRQGESQREGGQEEKEEEEVVVVMDE
jgi:hypothetical protein